MNKLYITNNFEKIKQFAFSYAENNNKEFICFEYNKDSINNIVDIYNKYDNIVIYLENITNTNISDKLLKSLEKDTNIDIFATTNCFNLSDALLARFDVQRKISHSSVESFIKTRTAQKKQYSTINFYISLAEYITQNPNEHILHNLLLVSNIISNIQQCGYNIPYSLYYDILRENYKC